VAWLWHRQAEPGLLVFLFVLFFGLLPTSIVALFVSIVLRNCDEFSSWWNFVLASLVGWVLIIFLARLFLVAQ
jgi:hypothetical protein